ncbi:MAG TPA: MogA/MoaB family molybdenum cofactor biosynthesis protein [Ktedonobacterales bacterium]|nr:MogA/MoaB family molybdenum cofactor biosynthesis protein [Ktedonobacterales bacterium]
MDDTYRVGILTISTQGAAGAREDTSGEAIRELMEAEPLRARIAERAIVPDDYAAIERTLRDWADARGLHLILTTGGTGLSPTDITPEATRAIFDREAPGIAEAMRAESLRHTPFGMLSRGVAGIRGATLIINLPGSPKGVRESIAAIMPALPHALDILTTRVRDHGSAAQS